MQLTDSIIPAVSGLLGVAVGAFFAQRSEESKRRLTFLERRLSEFYSPMLGLRKEIETESRLRVMIQDAGEKAWGDVAAAAMAPEASQARFKDFQRLLEYDNRKFEQELLPAYRRMITTFRDHLALAYPDTTEHFARLVKFVGVWERWIDKSIPGEALTLLQHSEADLHPFYDNLQRHHDELVAQVAAAKPDAPTHRTEASRQHTLQARYGAVRLWVHLVGLVSESVGSAFIFLEARRMIAQLEAAGHAGYGGDPPREYQAWYYDAGSLGFGLLLLGILLGGLALFLEQRFTTRR